MLEMLLKLADDTVPKLEDKDALDILDGAMLEGTTLELLFALIDETIFKLLGG